MTTLQHRAATLIEDRIGLTMAHHSQSLLDDILHNATPDDLASTLAQMEREPIHSDLWQKIIAELTIGETYFLRDTNQFQRLREAILPQIINRRRKDNSYTLDIWSAGCATGEEAYSLAITVFELLPDRHRWQINIHGTDINLSALATARIGVYRDWAFRHTPPEFQATYFQQVNGGQQINSTFREAVQFAYHNLLNPAGQTFDLILCRNVLIYFQTAYRQRAEETLVQALKPDGWLLLGPSEVLHTPNETVKPQPTPSTLAYQRQTIARQTSLYAPTLSPSSSDNSAIYNESVDALQSGNPERAERLIRPLLLMTPDHAPTHILYASLLTNQRDYSTALNHIDTALDIDPLNADGYYLRALIYNETGDDENAISALRAALYCQRNHPLATVMLATHYQSADEDKARRYWQNANQAIRSLMPHSPVANISDVTAEQLRRLIDTHLAQATPD